MVFVYIIQSVKSGRIYIGSTTNLTRRLAEHNTGKTYTTRLSTPWKYIYYEAYQEERDARLREKRLKYNGNANREVKQRIGLLPGKSRLKSGAGYTLVEVLLSIALVGFIAGTGAVVYQQLQNRNALDTAAATIATSSRRAQALSRAVDGDAPWGIRVATGSVVLFQGASYVARNSALDEVSGLPASITPSGLQEILFTKFSGLPVTPGTLSLTSSAGSRSLTINAQGTVNY